MFSASGSRKTRVYICCQYFFPFLYINCGIALGCIWRYSTKNLVYVWYAPMRQKCWLKCDEDYDEKLCISWKHPLFSVLNFAFYKYKVLTTGKIPRNPLGPLLWIWYPFISSTPITRLISSSVNCFWLHLSRMCFTTFSWQSFQYSSSIRRCLLWSISCSIEEYFFGSKSLSNSNCKGNIAKYGLGFSKFCSPVQCFTRQSYVVNKN